MTYSPSFDQRFTLFCSDITEGEIKTEIIFQFSGVQSVKVRRLNDNLMEVSFKSRKYMAWEIKKEIDSYILKQQAV